MWVFPNFSDVSPPKLRQNKHQNFLFTAVISTNLVQFLFFSPILILFLLCFTTNFVESQENNNSSTLITSSNNDTFESLPKSSAYLFKFEDDFKPKYNGTFLPRHKLNLTEAAKKIYPKVPDYYSPGEGPDDDDDDDEDEGLELSSAVEDKKLNNDSLKKSNISSSTTTLSPTTNKINSTETKVSTETSIPTDKLPQSSSYLFELGSDFKPKYNGTFLPRHKLNLTESAKKVYPKEPDFYKTGEGPDDDDDDENEPVEADKAIISSTTSTTTSTTTEKTQISTPSDIPSGLPKSSSYLFDFGPDFKPKYKGEFMPRHKLNLTEAAKKIYPKEPAYYEDGEGPEDDDEDENVDTVDIKTESSSTTSTTTTTTTESSKVSTNDIPSGLPKSSSYLFEFGPDFNPKYKGEFKPRHKLNLTEAAKKIYPKEPDYYEYGEGPEDDDDEDTDNVDGKDESTMNRVDTQIKSTTTTTTTTTTSSPSFYEDEEEDDIERAVGGISGILQKIIQGPKSKEINDHSTPEEVYSHLGTIISDEASKAIKATIPKIYDYQYPIGELISQRCLNSFAQFGDRVRKGYIWPMKMVASSSMGISRFALRDYGDYDGCLNVIADDDERKRQEQFFTGQYCLAKLHLPLPKRKAGMNYNSHIFNFNGTEVGGSLSDSLSSYGPFLYSNPTSFGLCVPSSCLPYEIEDVFNFFLKKWHLKMTLEKDCYSKVNLTVTALPGELYDVKINDLLKKEEQKTMWDTLQSTNSVQFWSIMFIISSVVSVICATFFENYNRNRHGSNGWNSTERARTKSFFSSFSIIYNYNRMFEAPKKHLQNIPENVNCYFSQNFPRTSSFPEKPSIFDDTSVLDVLKTLGLVWLCFANFYWLGFQSQMLPSVANIREIMLSLKNNLAFQIISQFWLSMDLFFLISGFLFAFTTLPYISRRDGRPSLLYFVVRRIIRFLPSIVSLMCILSLFPLWKNAGPMWNSGVEKILTPCTKFYWHNFFFISNLYETNQTCLPHLWYLSMEFQLTLLAMLITIFAYNRQKHSGKAFVALAALGIIYSGVKAYAANLRISVPLHQKSFLDDIPEMIRILHFSTPVHFTSYFIGLSLGFYSRLGVLKQTLFSHPKIIRNFLGIVLPLLTIFALYLPLFWPFKPRFKSERSATALYYGLVRIFFIGTFVWIINVALQSGSCVFKRFCSIPIFRIISSLSLQIYLFNVVIVWIYLFTKRTVIPDSLFETFSVAFSLFIITILVAFFTYFVFEAPYRSLYRYYFESPRTISLLSPVLHANNNGENKFFKSSINHSIGGNYHNNISRNGNEALTAGRIEQNGVNGNAGGNRRKIHSRELNPNFLFSPHYNLVTNVSSRAESETNSLSNFQMDPLANGHYSQHPNPDNGSVSKYPLQNVSTSTTASCNSIESNHETRITNDDLNNNSSSTISNPPTIVIEQ